MVRPIVTLTTDFATSDGFVAAMKGVILGINPNTVIVDLSHDIPPQDIASAAFVLATALTSFPADAIHVIVVDPGVGTDRRPVIVCSPIGTFICPDNGLLSYVLPAADEATTELPQGWSAYHITIEAYWRQPVSSTFHGRDIFAPVAGHLSLGLAPEHLGTPTNWVATFPVTQPVETDGVLMGSVIYVDRFGNLVTNIKGEQVTSQAVISVGIHTINGLSSSYQVGESPLAIINSTSHLEIAVSNGSAATSLRAGVGDEVRVKQS